MAQPHASKRKFIASDRYKNPNFADVTIKYSGRELKAHKIILCTRSKYFERALAEVGGCTEGGVIELIDNDPEAVEGIIGYIYTSGVPAAFRSTNAEWQDWLELALVAAKYGLTALDAHALEELEDHSLGYVYNTPDEISDLLQCMKCLDEYPRHREEVDRILLNLYDESFVDYFRLSPELREWLDGQPDLQQRLFNAYLEDLTNLPVFRPERETNGKLALKCLGI